MSQSPYLFFSDVDGTLMRTGGAIPPQVKAAAKRFTDAGGLLTLCTGRSWVSTERVVEELNIHVPCVLFTGAVIYDFAEKKILDGRTLDLQKLFPRLEKSLAGYPDIAEMAYAADQVYLLNATDFLRREGVKEEVADKVTPLSGIASGIFKVVLACEDPDRLRECAEAEYVCNDYYLSYTNPHFAEVVPIGADKGSAATRLAARLGVPMRRTFAAGDGLTDYAMFRVCAHSFAIEGSPDALVKLCNATIPSCERGGMEVAFDQARELMEEGWQGE